MNCSSKSFSFALATPGFCEDGYRGLSKPELPEVSNVASACLWIQLQRPTRFGLDEILPISESTEVKTLLAAFAYVCDLLILLFNN
ncbi:MAG: hypothetical protein VX694_15510 [Planctomycetota bacterium]|nr:hypothetical protein [Planctomycetota bacterium]MEC7680678.1 hypothetical protein [Planctomycetota bacterium]